jgi:hypothetical protein
VPAWISVAIVVALTLSLAGAPAAASGTQSVLDRATPAASNHSAWTDFNGDGFADIAIGAPGDDAAGFGAAGLVHVLYGGPKGLSSLGSQIWHQNRLPKIGGNGAEALDHFGTAVAAGDFNGDGFGDLAVGVPDEAQAGFSQAGAVQIIFGSEVGLTAAGAQNLLNHVDQTHTDLAGDRFGAALTALDRFDPNAPSGLGADGIADLAIGIPGTGVHNGRVRIVAGGPNGLGHGQASGISCPGTNVSARCGLALAAGALDSDGIDDLVIGAPDATVTGRLGAGMMCLDLTGDGQPIECFSEDDLSGRSAEEGAGFGSAFAIGDLGSSAANELLVGIPGKGVDLVPGPGRAPGAGAVLLFVGSSVGPSNLFAEINEASPGVPGDPGVTDAFGSSLELANLGLGPELDIIVGVPGEQVGANARAGAVIVLYGDGTKRIYHQDRPNILGVAGSDDHFGFRLFPANFGNGGLADLAVGVPRDTVAGTEVAGAVNVLYGSADGLTTVRNQRWTQESAGIGESAQVGDQFGAALP